MRTEQHTVQDLAYRVDKANAMLYLLSADSTAPSRPGTSVGASPGFILLRRLPMSLFEHWLKIEKTSYKTRTMKMNHEGMRTYRLADNPMEKDENMSGGLLSKFIDAWRALRDPYGTCLAKARTEITTEELDAALHAKMLSGQVPMYLPTNMVSPEVQHEMYQRWEAEQKARLREDLAHERACAVLGVSPR